jgi:dGTPase
MTERDDRFYPPQFEKPEDGRSPGRRDRDRILYSSAFRRLAGITQVISATDRFPIHNRLTHSLEVGQIGRTLAEKLLRNNSHRETESAMGDLDPDVVEAACLAHDLGHPPFGHVAEQELDRLVAEDKGYSDGFEGNAQSFRIVTKLAVRRPEEQGLNLTRATLRAILKYPWFRNELGEKSRKKWGAYESERESLLFARELATARGEGVRRLEAELMDWADDIAYAVHDLEDFYRAGIVPLDRLSTNESERLEFVGAEFDRNKESANYDADDLKRAFEEIIQISPIVQPYLGSHRDRARLKNFSSSLIDRYINAVSLLGPADELTIDEEARLEVTMLKGLTWHYVIESSALIAQRYGQKKLISSLFNILTNISASEKDRRIYPEFFRELLGHSPDDQLIVRTVADLISSMTESQVVDMHHRLTGISLGAALDPIVT